MEKRGGAIASVRTTAALGGRARLGQPFTAPVRPPTMRRWNRLKNTNAGIIDKEVNARTLAVSTEYCDAKACTPRGSVKVAPG